MMTLLDTAALAEPKDYAPLIRRYEQAKQRRSNWETTWQECYDYTLPQSADFTQINQPGRIRTDRLYDGTALDAVDQLAASLLGHLTPPWTQWFGFKPGPDLSDAEAQSLSPVLENAARIMQAHFDRSNFSVEMHQCFLDLVVGGTAALYFEEAEPGAFSAFKFSSVPLADIILEEGDAGFLDGSFRQLKLTLGQIAERYPDAQIPSDIARDAERDPQSRFTVLESILPDKGAYSYAALLTEKGPAVELSSGRFSSSPCIAFRWMKSPGEMYGRSPVMKALPDIKTANKVVELILKNASIAVTGIWQADDDGVLNPANIELVPGSIIPKAVGSAGLKPLEMPGRFDVSQLILEDLRSRIRHALLIDKLGQVDGKRMTAAEVAERSGEMALLLGATYGRLQSELLTPMIRRAYAILRRRGEIPDIALDGRFVSLDYRAPLARAQAQRNIQTIANWMSTTLGMGTEAASVVDIPRAARFLGEALGVPSDLIRKDVPDVLPQA
ncbi:MAG: phage tail protein [Micavibrio aeruginosavorus]|uniref:Phage tail protein n=1 Tax=Micavibrio aeruginosavorus TaxID=349221 RepID=A0A2W5N6J0_9BACT|nr:MAG: phage tail protein [Micavibrio aeruginosavorus]